MYYDGTGVPQDYVEAVKWYRLAAEPGQVWAQENLGFMYDQGKGFPQDFVSAHMWWNIASFNGDEDAGIKRDDVAKKMTPAEIAEAERRARVCLDSGYQECGG